MKFFTKMRTHFFLIFKFLVFTTFGLGFSACQKNPGTGGNSTITGSIQVNEYNNSNSSQLQGTYPGVGENVYIVYGHESNAPSDKVEAGINGTYEFKFLARGKYKIYAISALLKPSIKSDTTIVQLIEITKNKSIVEVPKILIKK